MNDADREILDHFIRTRAKTVELVRRVPDELLPQTPDGEESAFAQLFNHAGSGEAWWMANVLRDGGDQSQSFAQDKESILKAIQAAGNRVASSFSADDGEAMGRTFSFVDENGQTLEWTGRNRLLYFISHEVHHRGKIVLALRQCGFTDIPFLPF